MFFIVAIGLPIAYIQQAIFILTFDSFMGLLLHKVLEFSKMLCRSAPPHRFSADVYPGWCRHRIQLLTCRDI